jgi:hypothetical protein
MATSALLPSTLLIRGANSSFFTNHYDLVFWRYIALILKIAYIRRERRNFAPPEVIC